MFLVGPYGVRYDFFIFLLPPHFLLSLVLTRQNTLNLKHQTSLYDIRFTL